MGETVHEDSVDGGFDVEGRCEATFDNIRIIEKMRASLSEEPDS